MSRAARFVASLLLAGLPAGPAFAQTPEAAGYAGRLTVGGELSAALAPRDDDAFFTYTDYEHDALRRVRLRLFAEWRPAARVAFVAEVRGQNGTPIQAAAWYVRWRPWPQREVSVQAGRIPPVLGAFARRAYGRDNPLIGAPLAYQYLTSLRPDALPATADDLLAMRARGWRPSYPIGSRSVAPGIPLVSAFQWHTGVEVHWRNAWVEASGSLTTGAPAAPVVFRPRRGVQWSGRLAFPTRIGLTAGVSGARGQWVDDELIEALAASRPATQTIVGTDVEYGWGPWLVRGEALRSTFRLPLPAPRGDVLTAWSGFLEARYRFHPRWQTAVRLERLGFGRIAPAAGPARTWDAAVDALETVVSYRVTRQIDVRAGWVQHWRDGGRVRREGRPAVELLYWF
jgi:hypothetical protein